MPTFYILCSMPTCFLLLFFLQCIVTQVSVATLADKFITPTQLYAQIPRRRSADNPMKKTERNSPVLDPDDIAREMERRMKLGEGGGDSGFASRTQSPCKGPSVYGVSTLRRDEQVRNTQDLAYMSQKQSWCNTMLVALCISIAVNVACTAVLIAIFTWPSPKLLPALPTPHIATG